MSEGVARGPALALSRTFSPPLPPLQQTQPLRARLRNAGPSARERRASDRALGNFPSNAFGASLRVANAPSNKPFLPTQNFAEPFPLWRKAAEDEPLTATAKRIQLVIRTYLPMMFDPRFRCEILLEVKLAF